MSCQLGTLAWVATWTVLAGLSSAAVADQPIASWNRFEFAGNQSFSDEQLRTALVEEPDFLLAAHPHSDRSTIRKVAERLIVEGYRNAGFKSPQVKLESTDRGGGIITIDEGQRFRCGSIQIRGANQLNVDQLIERLTQPTAKENSFPTFVELHGETITRWVDTKGKLVDLEKPVWPLGSYVKFDTEINLSQKTIAALKDLGFSNTKVQITIETNHSDLNAELIVDILEEGTKNVAEVFHIVGTQTNSPNDVLKFLELKPGVVVDRVLVHSITKRLWDCGRFKQHHVHFDRNEVGQGRLNLELADVNGVPTLHEPLNETADVILRARSWLNSVNDRNEDISMTFRNEHLEFEIVQSQQGLLLQIRKNSRRALASDPSRLTLMFDDSNVTLENSQSETVWKANIAQFEGKVRLEANFAVAEEDDRFSRLQLNASCNSRRSNGEASFLSSFNASPADWLGFAYKSQLETHIADGRLHVTRGKERLEVDVVTGHIYRWDSEYAAMRVEASQFSRLKSQMESQSSEKHNDYDPSRPISTLVSHVFSPPNWELISEFWQLQYPDRKPLPPSLASASVKFLNSDLLRPLDAFAVYTANDQGKNKFEIPFSPPKTLDFKRMAIQMVGKYGLKCVPEVFAEGTWPMSVTREACLVMVDRGNHTGAVLKELQADDSTGPLCDASVAYLLSLIRQPVASTFAQRSLSRLNPSSLRSDREILMSGPCGRWMEGVLDACESLTDDEIDSLRAIGLNDQFVSGLDTIQKDAIQKTDNDNDDQYWYEIAKDGLEGMLGGIVRR